MTEASSSSRLAVWIGIAEEAGRLSVFQRSGNWFLPRKNHAYPAAIRAIIEHKRVLFSSHWLPALQRSNGASSSSRRAR